MRKSNPGKYTRESGDPWHEAAKLNRSATWVQPWASPFDSLLFSSLSSVILSYRFFSLSLRCLSVASLFARVFSPSRAIFVASSLLNIFHRYLLVIEFLSCSYDMHVIELIYIGEFQAENPVSRSIKSVTGYRSELPWDFWDAGFGRSRGFRD